MEIHEDLRVIVQQIEDLKDRHRRPFHYTEGNKLKGIDKTVLWNHLIVNLGCYVKNKELRFP